MLCSYKHYGNHELCSRKWREQDMRDAHGRSGRVAFSGSWNATAEERRSRGAEQHWSQGPGSASTDYVIVSNLSLSPFS